MPNWVENELTVAGPAAEMERFYKQFKPGADFSFKSLVPYPDFFRIADEVLKQWTDESRGKDKAWFMGHPRPEDGYNHGGHAWCVEHWGTKWDAHESHWGKRNEMTMIIFQTAWRPPLPFMYALMEAYPLLFINLEYFEGGACYCGGLWRAQYESDTLEPREIHEWCCDQYYGPRGG